MYDDERCDGDEGIKKLKSGDVVSNIEEMLGFDIESVSIKKGCQLKINTGKYQKKFQIKLVWLMIISNTSLIESMNAKRWNHFRRGLECRKFYYQG